MFSVINDDSRGGLDATHLSPHKPLSPSSSSHRDFSPLIVGGRGARREREKVFEIRKHLSSSSFFFFFFFFFLRFKVRVAGDYACGWGDKGVNGSDLRVNKSDERVATEACVRIKIQD